MANTANKITYLIALLLLLSSCYNQKKATKQAIRAQVEYPEVIAKLAADLYPCEKAGSDTIIVPADSTAFLEAMAEANQLIEGMRQAQDSLIMQLSNDTACKDYAPEVAKLRKENLALRSKLDNLPPVKPKEIHITDTVPRLAFEAQLKIERDNAIKARIKMEGERDAAKRQSKNRLWIILSLAGSWVLFIGLAIWRKTKKVPKLKSDA